jgi:hypothetical protein
MWPIPMLGLKSNLLAGLATCLLLTLVLLNRAWTEVAEKTAEIATMKTAAETFRAESERIAKEMNDAHEALVEQVKANAWKNYIAKYGMGGAARCPRIGGVLPAEHGTGQADRADQSDGPGGEQLVIEACGRDAGRLNAWIEWATLNGLSSD